MADRRSWSVVVFTLLLAAGSGHSYGEGTCCVFTNTDTGQTDCENNLTRTQCNDERLGAFDKPAACNAKRNGCESKLTGVPTMPEWSVVALTLLLLSAGTVVVSRRRVTA